MKEQVEALEAQIQRVSREGDEVRQELEVLKFDMHGITDTYRRDIIFKKLTSDVREVESIIEDSEIERGKQQKAIFGIMDYLNVGCSMIPEQASVVTQTDVTVGCQYSNFFTEVDERKLSLEATSYL